METPERCYSEQLTKTILQNSTIRVGIPLVRIDLDNMESPIVRTPNIVHSDLVSFSQHLVFKYEIRRIELTLDDSRIGNSPFVGFQTLLEYTHSSSKINEFDTMFVGVTYMNSANIVLQYKRKALNFFEVAGTLGGVFEIFDVFFGVILGTLSTLLFKKELNFEIEKAERKYNELRAKLERLEISQNNEENKNNAEEVKENPSHPLLSPVNEVLVKNIKKKDNLHNFNQNLDCIDIVYSIKTLQEQVAYLLRRDEKQRGLKIARTDNLADNRSIVPNTTPIPSRVNNLNGMMPLSNFNNLNDDEEEHKISRRKKYQSSILQNKAMIKSRNRVLNYRAVEDD